jgi:replicative DNA helicase
MNDRVVKFPGATPDPSALVNLEAEQQVLGGLMANNGILPKLAAIVDARHFADARHAEIYTALRLMIEQGRIANPVTLNGYVKASGLLEAIGGTAYLARLVSGIVSVAGAIDYARIVADLWQRRATLETLRLAIERTASNDFKDPLPTVLSDAVSALTAIGAQGQSSTVVGAGAAAMTAIDTIEQTARGAIVRTRTGFRDLDRKLGGLNPGRLYILGGRPSMGKTSAALWFAFNVASEGIPVLIVSLEMTADELSMRWLSGLTGIELEAMNAGNVDAHDQSRLVSAKVDLDALPIRIEDRPGLSLAEIETIARQQFRNATRALLIIDHLGLVGTPGREQASRVERTADVSNGLKTLAKRIGHPVLALAQLNRANEQREDKRPQLSDLRWAGELEQDADCIAFVHRESYYLERTKPKRRNGQTTGEFDQEVANWLDQCQEARGVAEFGIAKNRNGSVGTIEVAFNPATARFSDLARNQE